LNSLGPPLREFIEPFGGGGSVGLAALQEGLAKKVILVEIDPAVAAVWKTMLNGQGAWFARKVLNFRVTRRSVTQVLKGSKSKLRDVAFASLLRNRVQRGGIMAPAAGLMRKGEDGKGLASRWYPETLSARIIAIARAKRRIRFIHGDGIAFLMQRPQKRKKVAVFVDPPYMIPGKRLYMYSDIDHAALFQVAKRFGKKCLITCDNVRRIRLLARKFGYETRVVKMRTSHHTMKTELLISKSMEWFDSSSD